MFRLAVIIVAYVWALGPTCITITEFGLWAEPVAWLALFCPQPIVFRGCTYNDVAPRLTTLWKERNRESA